MTRARFVGGPYDGEEHETQGAHHHVLSLAVPLLAMTAKELIEVMATHYEDRRPVPIAQAFYVRRPRLEAGAFVYDFVRIEEP